MKKVLVASILGMALSAASSYGQGYIIMQNYALVGSTPVYSGVTYGSGANAGKFVGASSGIKVDLLYSLTGAPTASQVVSNSLTAFYTGSTDGGTPATDGAGSFFGATLVLPGYTSGATAFLAVQAFNGASYGAGTWAGTSAVFQINSVQTSSGLPAGTILNRGGNDSSESGTTVAGLQPFTVVPTPEPSIFALSGIGAAALMMFRRKK